MTTSKKKTSRRKSSSKTVISSAELKTWLEGVESMQDSNWHPSSEQWQKIREKISQLQEDAPVTPPTSNTGAIVHPVSPPIHQPVVHPPQNANVPRFTNKSPLTPVNADGLIDASPKNGAGGEYESQFGS